MITLSKREWIAFVVILALGLALRLPGLFNELWLDEVWSLTNALSAPSALAIFTSLKTDNNHHLTSLWLFMAGPDAPSWLYRSLAFTCGLGAVGVAFFLGRLDSLRHAALTALAVAVSFPFVYYSSEARGYAPVVFFVLTAWFCLRRFVDTGARPYLLAWWCSCVLGVLAHQTFVVFFLAALVWCDAHTQRASKSVRTGTRLTAIAFAVPAVAFAVFYLVSLRGTALEGGPSSPRIAIISRALAQLVGFPAVSGIVWVAAVLVAGAFLGSLVTLMKRGNDRWLMYLSAAALGPILLFLAQPSAATYPRYFLVPTTFVLLACVDALSFAAPSALWRVVTFASFGVMCWGCIDGVRELAVYGRGRFDLAVGQMSREKESTVAYAPEYSGFDVRGQMLINYYGRRTAGGNAVHYVSEDAYPRNGTDWIIRENIYRDAPSTAEFVDRWGNAYRFVQEYKAASLAGIAWRLYRRKPVASGP